MPDESFVSTRSLMIARIAESERTAGCCAWIADAAATSGSERQNSRRIVVVRVGPRQCAFAHGHARRAAAWRSCGRSIHFARVTEWSEIMDVQQLHHVSLPVTRLERSRAFYRDVLGL